MEKGYEIERLFNKEITYKKRVGRGIHNRASRTGKIGLRGVKTASDYLTKKQIKALSGEVRMSNKYYDLNNITSWKELRAGKSDEILLDILKNLRERYTSDEIAKTFKVRTESLYKIFSRYGAIGKDVKAIRKHSGRREPGITRKELPYAEILAELPIYDEFLKYDNDNRRKVLLYAMKKVSGRTLARAWGAPPSTIYTFLTRLHLSKKAIESEVVDYTLDDILKPNTERVGELKIVGEDEALYGKRSSGEDEELETIQINSPISYEEYIKERNKNIVEENSNDESEVLRLNAIIEKNNESIKELNNMVSELKNKIAELENGISISGNNISDGKLWIDEKNLKIGQINQCNVNNENSLRYVVNGEFSAVEARNKLTPITYLLLDEYNYNIKLEVVGSEKR